MSDNTPAGAGGGGDHELVTCVLGGVEFGIDINAVQEIVRLPKITPVPRAPSYVEGVANLRGNVLPIVNSRARFGMPGAGNGDSNRVVVVELNGAPTGLIVDAVREVMRVKRADVEDAPAAVQSVDGRFLRGVVKLNGGQRLVLLLDHSAIMEAARPAGRPGAAGPTPGGDPAASGAALRAAPPTPEHEHLVTFRIGEEEYGVPIMDVQEIIRVPNISTIPNAPAGVVGIASLRNRILPVLDLRTKFEFRPRKAELEEFCDKVRAFERLYTAAVERLQAAVAGRGAFDRALLRGHRDFCRWQAGFASGDRLLHALLAPLRDAFDAGAAGKRAVAAHLDARNFAAAQQEFDGPFQVAHARLLAAFEKLYTGVTRRDDERCLVATVNGAALALRVDAVNQVLQAPRGTIEPTPALVAGREQLRGIAKLDGGKRLIMLLAADKLVSHAELSAVTNLTDRSEGAGRGPGAGGESDERQLVTFKVAGEEFAVDIMQVQEIIRLGKVTKVPHLPDFVEGVVNLRGQVLPVIDLRRRVHLARKDYSDATRVVVVDLRGTKTGIIVDAVSEVMRVRGRDIEPAPPIIRSRYGDHIIEGVGKLNKGDRMFLLLRADELLKVESVPAASA